MGTLDRASYTALGLVWTTPFRLDGATLDYVLLKSNQGTTSEAFIV